MDPGKTVFFLPAGQPGVILGGAYTGTERVEKADWYDWFDRARRKYDAAGKIREETVVVLGILKGMKMDREMHKKACKLLGCAKWGLLPVAKRMRRARKQSCAS